ncbi:hypothetical protein F4679DRAFT_37768 [Xylaria curta]|nr:hypothetical protein F4679DRAFT_37768 [Xylaria curta]
MMRVVIRDSMLLLAVPLHRIHSERVSPVFLCLVIQLLCEKCLHTPPEAGWSLLSTLRTPSSVLRGLMKLSSYMYLSYPSSTNLTCAGSVLSGPHVLTIHVCMQALLTDSMLDIMTLIWQL